MQGLLTLVWCALFICLAAFWWQSQGVKQRALKACRRYCETSNLQMLDDSLVLKHLKLRRNKSGALSFCRTYEFEFSSTGGERYHGEIKVHGNEVPHISTEVHRLE